MSALEQLDFLRKLDKERRERETLSAKFDALERLVNDTVRRMDVMDGGRPNVSNVHRYPDRGSADQSRHA